jgi:hypothetical protein
MMASFHRRYPVLSKIMEAVHARPIGRFAATLSAHARGCALPRFVRPHARKAPHLRHRAEISKDRWSLERRHLGVFQSSIKDGSKGLHRTCRNRAGDALRSSMTHNLSKLLTSCASAQFWSARWRIGSTVGWRRKWRCRNRSGSSVSLRPCRFLLVFTIE